MRSSIRPKVLVFIDWYRPFYKAGGPVRSLVNMVDQLNDAVDFHIVTGDRDYMATMGNPGSRTDEWTVGEAGERVWFASRMRRSVAQWRRLLSEERWDIIYLNGLFSPWTTALPLWLLRGSKVRRIVAVRGMLAPDALSGGRMKKELYLRTLRIIGCLNQVEFQATSEPEVLDIRRWFGDKVTIHLVPNLARKEHEQLPVSVVKQPGRLHLVSVARIAPEKNTLFALEQLSGLNGEVHFDLFGTVYDDAYWAQCRAVIDRLPKNITVTWHGHVDQLQARGALAQGHAMYLPTLGENFGHTMLEALSAGRPLIISDRTPWRELEHDDAGWDIPLERPEVFSVVLRTMVDMDQTRMDRLVQGSFQRGMRYLTDPAPLAACRAMFGV